jgi:hypothetical protein
MHKRQITLADGRYLIFYTFEDENKAPAASSAPEDAEGKRREPTDPKPEAEDERHV